MAERDNSNFHLFLKDFYCLFVCMLMHVSVGAHVAGGEKACPRLDLLRTHSLHIPGSYSLTQSIDPTSFRN